MHAIVRTYSGPGAKELFDVIEAHKLEVGEVIKAIAGFVSFTAVRTSDGGFTLTVAEGKTGIEESSKAAREWIKLNAPNVSAAPPTVAEGDVFLHVK